jgi:hypothetical protein
LPSILGFDRRDKKLVKRTLYSQGFAAQLFRDPGEQEYRFFHYIVTRAQSTEILAWGQEFTEEAAEAAALNCIQELCGRVTKSG